MTARGTRIYNFAIANLGRQVGNGQCWTLAFQAVRAARGRVPPANDLYNWGQSIPFAQLSRGDIIQFYLFRTDIERASGSEFELRGDPDGVPHHTAIFSALLPSGAVELLEQNIDGVMRVRRSNLFIQNGTFGSGSTATTVETSGGITFYRVQ